MDEVNSTVYLDRLLELYSEKLSRFRVSLTLLLVGTTIFLFLVFLPYVTLIGNQLDCQTRQKDCPQLEQSEITERVSDVTTSWGNIPISTSELVTFFPAGVACGFLAVTAQLQGLSRLRRAIDQQLQTSKHSAMDSTLIAPLLIDPRQSLLDQLMGTLVISFPAIVVVFSINLLLRSLTAIRRNLPYFQSESFYHGIYSLSILLTMYGLTRVGITLFTSRNHRSR